MRDKIEYVHVIDRETGESIHAVECKSQRAERVARGMDINLNHDRYELSITHCGHPVANAHLCMSCAVEELRDHR